MALNYPYKILVVGGFGYVGSRIYEYFLSHNFDVYRSTSRVFNASDLNFDRTLFLDPTNISQISDIFVSFDVVIDAYGLDSASCLNDPSSALIVNGVNTSNLILAAVQSHVELFIYFSTAHVYASPLIGYVDEHSNLSNLHPYATSHSAGELSVLYQSSKSTINALVIRLSNAFGPPIYFDSTCWNLFANNISREAVFSRSLTIKNNRYISLDFVPLSLLTSFLADYIFSYSKYSNVDLINFGSFSSLTLLEFATLVQDRCQHLFDYSPALIFEKKYSDSALTSELHFRTRYNELLPQITRHHLISEVDKLLIYCRQNNS